MLVTGDIYIKYRLFFMDTNNLKTVITLAKKINVIQKITGYSHLPFGLDRLNKQQIVTQVMCSKFSILVPIFL